MKASIQNSEFRIQNSKKLFHAFLILNFSFLIAATAAPEGVARFERTFADAAKAYDENRLPEAIAGWEALVADGQNQPETLFNLGNAYYRNGNLGKAILTYRRAQRLAPRDPDIRANLGFAAQSAGIEPPARKPLAAVLLDFSRAEWLGFGVACFWLLAGALAVWIAWPRFRFVARPAAGVLAALLLLALAGLALYRDLDRTPEGVVMLAGQKVLSSPLDTATPLLAVPAGAIVRMRENRGTWIEVEIGETRGWLPAAALAPVR